MNGYAGKILRVNLSNRAINVIPTMKYEQWVGGHGMGSAIFYDIMIKEKKIDLERIDGFHPESVMTLMTSPLSGTLVPAASGRTEVQAIGLSTSPIGWFTRGNFGGRFSSQLKFAGWDGIVIEGKADSPVWLDIRDDDVHINYCEELSLWGTNTRECQERIWEYVAGNRKYGGWIKPRGGGKGRTTQRPAVLATGPAGENLCRIACLIHDAANAVGYGGFGAVWGAKNLKAVSVIGTSGFTVADPKSLLRARLAHQQNYVFKFEKAAAYQPSSSFGHTPTNPSLIKYKPGKNRPQACVGCHAGCRSRFEGGLAKEVKCGPGVFYWKAKNHEVRFKSMDLMNELGLNYYEVNALLDYLVPLYKKGLVGPGKQISCDIDFGDFGSYDFIHDFFHSITYRKGGFGDAMAQGCYRASRKWGRAEEDLASGLLECPYWGLPEHAYDPRAEVSYGYGTVLADRDITEHDFNGLFYDPTFAVMLKKEAAASAERAVAIYTGKIIPYSDDMLMLDYSTENIYSEHMVKLVSWHRHYTRFWKHSVLYCDLRWPDMLNIMAPDLVGSSGTAEPEFFNIVTGKNLTFLDGIALGKKIWNLDHAIWTLQGRHRDMVQFAEYIYTKPFDQVPKLGVNYYLLPGKENGEWKYIDVTGRHLDRDKFEQFKTNFYEFEGWDPSSGYPLNSTLNDLGLEDVSSELALKNKIGAEHDIKNGVSHT
ncbi:MAG: aldehyde ferredoxin oxidoreductase N-terminal domain-containing protein [Desulfobacterales bacterium]